MVYLINNSFLPIDPNWKPWVYFLSITLASHAMQLNVLPSLIGTSSKREQDGWGGHTSDSTGNAVRARRNGTIQNKSVGITEQEIWSKSFHAGTNHSSSASCKGNDNRRCDWSLSATACGNSLDVDQARGLGDDQSIDQRGNDLLRASIEHTIRHSARTQFNFPNSIISTGWMLDSNNCGIQIVGVEEKAGGFRTRHTHT
jgi:hypothetical protein